MVNSRDVQDVVSRLSSDKAKIREEGIKLLNLWLDGERSFGFCKYIGQNTAQLKSWEVPHEETWPFLVTMLIQCVSLELSASKRRVPKLVYAKTLRITVQRAESARFSGCSFPLISVAKLLFNHIWDVLSNVPSYQSEYGVILRLLLAAKDYYFQMRKRIYGSMVLFYMEKVETSLRPHRQSSIKEEPFRCTLMLHALLENPPGDFPEPNKENFANGFVKIFSLLRDEGKIARKLLECVNVYLLRDGTNIGSMTMVIHESLQQFVLRFWLATHDPGLKDALIVYARLQLCLTRDDANGCLLLEQLSDLVFKDLDQRSLSGSGVTRSEGIKDEKFCVLTGSYPGLVDLASLVLYKSCMKAKQAQTTVKKMRREHAAVRLKEALGEGKWLWNATFCRLTRVYYCKMSQDLFHYWFESLNAGFERIMNNANGENSYNALLWTLRTFRELSLVLLLSNSHDEFGLDWQGTWNCLVQGLPILSNITHVVDAALFTLGNILLRDLGISCIVPKDVWDLPIFKRLPSSSMLYFISCYFSRKHSQGGMQDMLHLRKNLLRTILDPLRWRDSSSYGMESVLMLPSALCALSTGFDPLRHTNKTTHRVQCPQLSVNFSEAVPGFKEEEKSQNLYELLDCSVEALSQIYMESTEEVLTASIRQDVRLPRQLKDTLLSVLEMNITEALSTKEIKFDCLSDIFFICGVLANLLFCLAKIRMREEGSLLSKVAQLLLELLQHAVYVVEDGAHDINPSSDQSASNRLSIVVASFKCFVSSNYFTEGKFEKHLDARCYSAIFKTLECLLKSVVNIYESCQYERGSQADVCSSATVMRDHGDCTNESDKKDGVMDMDLDHNDDINDFVITTDDGDVADGSSFSLDKWKLGIIELISCFFTVLPGSTWDILFELMKKELDHVVLEDILHRLCKFPYWSSVEKVSDMLSFLISTGEMRMNLKLDCLNIVIAIRSLMATSLSLVKDGRDVNQILFMKDEKYVQTLMQIGELLNGVAKADLLKWAGRVELVGSMCDMLLLHPKFGEMLIGRLLMVLHDCDYRVRLSLARRIDVLFQTWEGHIELFEDICSSFGVVLVICSNGKVVTAKEVLAAGSQPRPILETAIITLLHMALHSERIELEAVFMICGISAIEPAVRELVKIMFDSLSRQLQYSSRFKYLEELLGPILFCWTACSLSIGALVEVKHLFVQETEPCNFVQYICPCLIPALLLHEDATADLKWLSNIVDLPLAALLRSHFVSIFAISMALHCSKQSHLERGSQLMQNVMLRLADMSESERDDLIKKHMVSIVGFLLSLSSNVPDPAVPFFSTENIFGAIKEVVDGFMDQGSCQALGVVDKINIFREDRVFMFILEIHYKISASCHNRHRCHKLGQLEVLIRILQNRAATASTSNYLFNLVGQYIGYPTLQPQCCRIIWSLLEAFENKPSQKMIIVLGEQLQAVVSKLVSCCIPYDDQGGGSPAGSSQVLAVLKKLLLQRECFLHDYIRELEPLPEIDVFNEFKPLHEDLYRNCSPREHLLKLVKRAWHLPPRLLLWSLQAVHKKFLLFQNHDGKIARWQDDSEVVNAVWTLVRMCSSSDFVDVRALVADLLSRVGIGDPHCVVYHLPGEPDRMHICDTVNAVKAQGTILKNDSGVPEELIISLLKVLKKYLMDDSPTVVDVTSQALRGILSTGKGQAALSRFELYDISLIEIHSRGINMELVEDVLLDLKQKSNAEAIPLEKSILWETNNKTFDTWICRLVFSLIGHCEDIILRLCQDIARLKAEVAELLLPHVMVNLAMKNDEDESFCSLVSLQVEMHIFAVENQLMKSIQIFLNVLNELRLCYVMNESCGTLTLSKRDSLKETRRHASSRARDLVRNSGSFLSLWKKVYWLSIDYLIVAKSAVLCGQYFTSVMYAEYWCEDHFKSLSLGRPDFSPNEKLPDHIEILVSAITQINEPDSLYGIIQAHQLISQIITFEHEGNWSKAIEYYDLQVRSEAMLQADDGPGLLSMKQLPRLSPTSTLTSDNVLSLGKPHKGLIRAMQRIGCTHLLDLYFHGLTSCKGDFQYDEELAELQYEAAWRAGNWDFCLLSRQTSLPTNQHVNIDRFNESLLCCLRALKEGEFGEFHEKLHGSKQKLVWLMSHASEESTEYIFSTVIKLQILHHLDQAWDLRWKNLLLNNSRDLNERIVLSDPLIPGAAQMTWLESDWEEIIKRSQMHMNLLDPFIAFRKILLNILGCEEYVELHLLRSVSTLRKGSRLSQAAASLHEFKHLTVGSGKQFSSLYWVGRLEDAKLLHAQGQKEMAISLAKFIAENSSNNEKAPDVHRLIGKWLAETRSSSSRTILENYLKPAVSIAGHSAHGDKKSSEKQSQAHYQLAHYSYALFRSCEERLNSSEWQAALRLRKHKTLELEALIKRLRSSTKGEKTDFSAKIQELQKQLTIDKEEDEKMQDDRDNFLNLALDGYKQCLVIGDKYDVKVVFCLLSLWFGLSSRPIVIDSMLKTIEEVQSYKFVPLVYQIASRLGASKDGPGPNTFQRALVSLLKKMAVDHPYHTVFQLLALANGDRIKDKQRSRNSFVVDFEKKLAAENLLDELSTCHGTIIKQMRQMVEIYIKLAELETRREDTNKRMTLPREIRSVRCLELVPVVTASFPIDRSCQYQEGSFPYFHGLEDSFIVMNGINAPKVVECLGSDGHKYRQLAKSGNDDLRQDAVMEQFFGLVNTFLRNNQDTRRRGLGVRTYKVVPFTPSAGVLEWVNGTLPLGEYLIGSMRNGGAHGRYGQGDWSFMKCREHMANEKDKRKAFHDVCSNFRPVMHHFFLERFSLPADWFERRLAYTRSVATSSMVGYVVGLGDRHSTNILIDQASAEVVHIDLGVAFEQGLMLKTPERVPFRLTRDIIDGMGVTGVEGVFRRCCEETLSVMRMNKEALLTIVEVFIHDPLYKWALSPLKALQRQKEIDDESDTSIEDSEDEYEGNKDAARALMRVKQKLDGYEDGELRSVHGQVQQLIQDAIDPERLGHMFPGWGAWL